MIDRSDVVAAQGRIAFRIRRTPVFDATVTSPAGPVPVRFKLEFLQLGGSFKIRGSLNTLAHNASGAASIVIASGGNAGIAAATAARMAGITCRVVVPEQAPVAKVATLRSLGAVGGGGLVSGIATALPGRQVIGVEPTGAPTLFEMLRTGAVVDVEIDSIAADSLGATRLGGIAAEVVVRHGVRSVVVPDEAIIDARTYLWREFRIAVEWGAATALAAIRSGAYVPEPGERPVVVLCGANTDPAGLTT